MQTQPGPGYAWGSRFLWERCCVQRSSILGGAGDVGGRGLAGKEHMTLTAKKSVALVSGGP